MTSKVIQPDSVPTLTRGQLTLLIGGLLTTAIGQSFIFAILPPLGREVGFNEVQVNSIISSSALIFSLGSAWWGNFSDRAGRKAIIIAGLLGYAIGTLLFALCFAAGLGGWITGLPLFVTALFLRCGQAMIMSATSPGAAAYAADFSARQVRGRVLARLGTANSLGMIFGPILAGALAGFGLLFPLYIAAALAGVATLVIALYLPPDLYQSGAHRSSAKLSVFDPRLRLYLFVSFSGFTGFSGIQQTLGFRLQDMLSLTGPETAQYTGMCLMVTALCTFIMQMTIAQRFSGAPIVLIRAGVALLLTGALIVAAASSFTGILIAMGTMGTGLGLAVPAIAAAASLAVSPEEQGGTAGLVTALPAAGFVIGPISCGALYTLSPALSALGAASILAVATITALLGQRNKRYQ